MIYSTAMSISSDSTERQRNLWAPWRMEYIDTLSGPQDGCFLCRYRDDPQNDQQNLVLWRGANSFAVMNRFPYTGGHCLVAPYAHVGNMGDLDALTMTEIMELLRDLQAGIQHAIRPDGFNIGMNIGRCAGAGLPDHIHLHVVPRWSGDTNFMPILGGAHVIPDFLETIHEKISHAGRELGLPKFSADEKS